MVKGSAGSRMGVVVDALSALGDTADPPISAPISNVNDTNGKTARAVQQG